MKQGKLFFLFVVLIAFGCKQAPEYPAGPSISPNSVERFLIVDQTLSLTDSIIIHVDFKDGDGDLGLESHITYPPYHPYAFITSGGNYIQYGDSDTLPPYNCNDYILEHVDSDPQIDTILVKKNPNRFNFFIDFLVKQDDGSFQKFDFSPYCLTYDGRFPPLTPENYEGPIDGTLSYELEGAGLRDVFEGKTVKFRIQVQDRRLRKSNFIETEEVFFDY